MKTEEDICSIVIIIDKYGKKHILNNYNDLSFEDFVYPKDAQFAKFVYAVKNNYGRFSIKSDAPIHLLNNKNRFCNLTCKEYNSKEFIIKSRSEFLKQEYRTVINTDTSRKVCYFKKQPTYKELVLPKNTINYSTQLLFTSLVEFPCKHNGLEGKKEGLCVKRVSNYPVNYVGYYIYGTDSFVDYSGKVHKAMAHNKVFIQPKLVNYSRKKSDIIYYN